MKRSLKLAMFLVLIVMLLSSLNATAECQHLNTNTIESSERVSIEPEGQDGHRVILKIWDITICADCQEELKRVLNNTEEIILSHTYDEPGICSECGYVNFCEHKNTYQEEFELPSDEYGFISIDENYHEITYLCVKQTVCSDCGECLEFESNYEKRLELHYFDMNGICNVCGYHNANSIPDDPTPNPQPTIKPTIDPAPTATPTSTISNSPTPTLTPTHTPSPTPAIYPTPSSTPSATPTSDIKNGFSEKDGYLCYYTNGEIDTTRNGLVLDSVGNVWYYCALGRAQTQYSGLAEYGGEWFYVENGKLNTTRAGLVTYDGGRFMIAAGRILREYSGLILEPNTNKWYYVAAGQVADYTGLVLYDGAWFYVVNGELAVNYTGEVEYDGATFQVVGGQLVA